MTQSSIPDSSALIAMIPGYWMIGAHCTALVGRLIQRHEHVDTGTRIRPEIVPFVGASPERGQHRGRGMRSVYYVDGGLGDARMTTKVGTDQIAVPGPFIAGVAS